MTQYSLKEIIVAMSCLFLCAKGISFNGTLELKVKRWQVECVEENNVNPLSVLKISCGIWDVPEFKGNVDVQNWALCILVKAGIMSPQGIFKLDEANELIHPSSRERVLDKVDKCLYKTRHTPGEIAWTYLKCFNRDEPKKLKII